MRAYLWAMCDMHQHHLKLLFLRDELKGAAENFCRLVELNIGIPECDVAKIYKMILIELDLVKDITFASAPFPAQDFN